MPRSIKQEVVINGTTEQVYACLTDSKQHAAFSEAPARISKKEGGKFTCYGGYIEGYNVELVENKMIVQAWRGSDWKAGEWSLIKYTLKKKGKKTALTFEQYGIPDKHVTHIRKGWKQHYWDKLNEYFAK